MLDLPSIEQVFGEPMDRPPARSDGAPRGAVAATPDWRPPPGLPSPGSVRYARDFIWIVLILLALPFILRNPARFTG